MTAYNQVNGAFMGANRPLVRRTLLGDFGFKGFVLSDFVASGDTVGSALAGQSLALPAATYYEPSKLRAALAAGTLTRQRWTTWCAATCARCSASACSTAGRGVAPRRCRVERNAGSPARSRDEGWCCSATGARCSR